MPLSKSNLTRNTHITIQQLLHRQHINLMILSEMHFTPQVCSTGLSLYLRHVLIFKLLVSTKRMGCPSPKCANENQIYFGTQDKNLRMFMPSISINFAFVEIPMGSHKVRRGELRSQRLSIPRPRSLVDWVKGSERKSSSSLTKASISAGNWSTCIQSMQQHLSKALTAGDLRIEVWCWIQFH